MQLRSQRGGQLLECTSRLELLKDLMNSIRGLKLWQGSGELAIGSLVNLSSKKLQSSHNCMSSPGGQRKETDTVMVKDNPNLHQQYPTIQHGAQVTDPTGEIESHVRQILDLLRLDINDPSLMETPRRVAKYLREFRQKHDYREILGDGFKHPGAHGLIAQSNIPFRMACEHHLLPALGRAAIGYFPDEMVVGLSKLTRLVQAVGTEKPSLQEVVCDRIADIFDEHVHPRGVIVTIRAEHSCMACRGVNTPDVLTHTSSVRGLFRDVPQARAEFFSLIGR